MRVSATHLTLPSSFLAELILLGPSADGGNILNFQITLTVAALAKDIGRTQHLIESSFHSIEVRSYSNLFDCMDEIFIICGTYFILSAKCVENFS